MVKNIIKNNFLIFKNVCYNCLSIYNPQNEKKLKAKFTKRWKIQCFLILLKITILLVRPRLQFMNREKNINCHGQTSSEVLKQDCIIPQYKTFPVINEPTQKVKLCQMLSNRFGSRERFNIDNSLEKRKFRWSGAMII